MKKISDFNFDNFGAFVEAVTVQLDCDEWASLNNFMCVWFMVDYVDKLYIDFTEGQMVLNNQLMRFDESDEEMMSKYIKERFGIDKVFAFDFDSYKKAAICYRFF